MKPTKAKYKLIKIPDGRAGIRATLKIMSKIVNRYKTSPYIRELAISIIQDVPQKDWHGQIEAIFRYVRDNINYVHDVRGVETLQSPVKTLELRRGDCDDQSVLAASLLEAIRHPTRFVAVGYAPNTLSHVFAQTKLGAKWITLDCIMETWPLGKTTPGIRDKMIQHN